MKKTKHKEYIILIQRTNGEYKPILFNDGTIVIYGNLSEAKEDAGEGGIVAELKINKNG